MPPACAMLVEASGGAVGAAEAAARSNDASLLRSLLAAQETSLAATDKLPPDGRPTVNGEIWRPALATAIANNSIEALLVLIEELGANAWVDASAGWTCLHAAAFLNAELVAELLLAKGADLHLKSATGQTAVEVACSHGNDEVLQVLANPHKALAKSCGCGNWFMEDFLFCSRCGAKRSEAPTSGFEDILCQLPASTADCITSQALAFERALPATADVATTTEPLAATVEAAVQGGAAFSSLVDIAAQTSPPAQAEASAQCCTAVSEFASQCALPAPGASVGLQAAVVQVNASLQCAPEVMARAIQNDPVLTANRLLQTDELHLRAIGSQCDEIRYSAISTQTAEGAVYVEAASQYVAEEMVEDGVQCSVSLVDAEAQALPDFADNAVQHQGPEMIEFGAQYVGPERESVHCAVQCDPDAMQVPQAVAAIGVDVDHDGQIDYIQVVAGEDRNRDGIPDALQSGSASSSGPAAHNAEAIAGAAASSSSSAPAEAASSAAAASQDAPLKSQSRPVSAQQRPESARAAARRTRKIQSGSRANMPPEAFSADIKATGIGRELKWAFDSDGCYISSFKNAPVADLLEGDRLVAINEFPLDGLQKDRILELWKREHGASEFTTLFFRKSTPR